LGVGGCPTAGYLLLLAQKKSNPRKGHPTSPALRASLRFAAKAGGRVNSACGLRQTRPTSPASTANPRRLRGEEKRRCPTVRKHTAQYAALLRPTRARFLENDVKFILGIAAFCINSAWATTDSLSPEQQSYCDYMKNEWGVSCKAIKKEKFTSERTRKIIIGCQGPGIHCGGKIYFYTRVNATMNQCTKARVDIVKYDEEWSFRDKGGASKVYWRKGSFIYEGSISKHFGGFDMGAEHFKESMGKDREWFSCEVPQNKRKAQ